MELNSLDFTARKRTSWEVFDLTLLAVRRWGLRLFVLWFLQAAIVFIPMALLLESVSAIVIVWWLKPVMERPLLHYVSQATFGYKPTILECIAVIPKLGFVKIFLMLTWRRLSFQRAFLAPIDQLEVLKGENRSNRISVLDSLSNHRQAFWLIFCVHLEYIITGAFSVALYAMIPGTENIEFDANLLFLYEDSVGVMGSLTTLIGYGLVAPYYVTGGFLGYLNSRVELEAWDIELAFKRMVKRVVPVLMLVLCVPLLFTANMGTAEAATITAESVESVDTQISELYNNEEVVVVSQSWQPVFDPNFDFDFGDLQWLADFLEWVIDVAAEDYSWFGALFWFVIIAVLGFVIWKLLRMPRFQLGAVAKPIKMEIPQFVTSIKTRDIPDDLLRAAREANNDGNTRLALTWLLYFGLGLAQTRYNVVLQSSMTEGECQSELSEHLEPESLVPFNVLFDLWVAQAWAHKQASFEAVDALIDTFSAFNLDSRSVSPI